MSSACVVYEVQKHMNWPCKWYTYQSLTDFKSILLRWCVVAACVFAAAVLSRYRRITYHCDFYYHEKLYFLNIL